MHLAVVFLMAPVDTRKYTLTVM